MYNAKYFINNKNMVFLIFFLIITILILSFLRVDIIFNENFLLIKVFKIPIFKKSSEQLMKLFSKVDFNKINQEENKQLEINILEHIKFLKINIILKTIVNNYRLFFYQNVVISSVLTFFYPLIKDKIPNFSLKYQEANNNELFSEIKMQVNVLLILIVLMKGKLFYGSKRNQSNA